jgi:hypothetical protein
MLLPSPKAAIPISVSPVPYELSLCLLFSPSSNKTEEKYAINGLNG